MSKPQVINVPPNSGFGTVPPVQVPLINNEPVTLFNMNAILGLTLCNDDRFNPTTTWPLNGGMTLPITGGVNNLWIQNPNNSLIQLLVLQGIVPVSFNVMYPPSFSIAPVITNSETLVTIIPGLKVNFTQASPGYIIFPSYASDLTLDINFTAGDGITGGITHIIVYGEPSGYDYVTLSISNNTATSALSTIISTDTELKFIPQSSNDYAFFNTITVYYFAFSPITKFATDIILTYQILNSITSKAVITDISYNVLGTIDMSDVPGIYTIKLGNEVVNGCYIFAPYINTTGGQIYLNPVSLSGIG